MKLTLQTTNQNDMLANNNTYKVSKNKHTTDEDKTNKYTRRQTNTRETLLKLKIQKTEHDKGQNRHENY